MCDGKREVGAFANGNINFIEETVSSSYKNSYILITQTPVALIKQHNSSKLHRGTIVGVSILSLIIIIIITSVACSIQLFVTFLRKTNNSSSSSDPNSINCGETIDFSKATDNCAFFPSLETAAFTFSECTIIAYIVAYHVWAFFRKIYYLAQYKNCMSLQLKSFL